MIIFLMHIRLKIGCQKEVQPEILQNVNEMFKGGTTGDITECK